MYSVNYAQGNEKLKVFKVASQAILQCWTALFSSLFSLFAIIIIFEVVVAIVVIQ